MLVDDGSEVRLLADPARLAGARRVYSRFAIGCGVVTGMALLSGIGMLVTAGPPAGWALAIGFAVAAAFFGGLTWWFARAVSQVARFAAQDSLLRVGEAGLVDPGVGSMPWSTVRKVTVTWKPVRRPRPVGIGGRLGRAAAQRALDRAQQDQVFRQLTVDRAVGPPVLCSGGAMARDEDFGAFVAALARRLADRGIPLTVDRGRP